MSANVPDPTPVLDLLNAFRTSAVMFAGVSLGVFDILTSESLAAGTLAKRLSADVDALTRLLDTCVGLGLLERRDGCYRCTPVATTYLSASSPRRMTGYINYSHRVLWKLWAELPSAIREGTHRWKQVFGLEGPIFSAFFRTEADKREFIQGMHGFGEITSPAVVEAFDLSGFRRLADLGGATGHLALAACRRYPQLHAVIFDLEEVVPLANERIAAEPELADRLTTQAGDFFLDELPPADLYALGRILHDWSEDKIRRLLARIYSALPANGALLICEKLLDDDKTGPLWAQLQSLNMLLCTEGKERTLAEYRVLLEEAGFRRVEGRRTPHPLDAVLAWKQ